MSELTIGLMSIGALMITQLVAFAYGYGKITNQIKTNSDNIKIMRDTAFADISIVKHNYSALNNKIDTLSERLVRIETLVINGKKDNPK